MKTYQNSEGGACVCMCWGVGVEMQNPPTDGKPQKFCLKLRQQLTEEYQPVSLYFLPPVPSHLKMEWHNAPWLCCRAAPQPETTKGAWHLKQHTWLHITHPHLNRCHCDSMSLNAQQQYCVTLRFALYTVFHLKPSGMLFEPKCGRNPVYCTFM